MAQSEHHAVGSIVWASTPPVARVTLSHPGQLNAISIQLWRELRQSFEEISARTDIRLAVISG
ncbi:MAG: hypothetical protein ACKOCR_02445, partial [Burkholderiaceae bacterium]